MGSDDTTPEQDAERNASLYPVYREILNADADGKLDEATAFHAIRVAYMHGYLDALRARGDE